VRCTIVQSAVLRLHVVCPSVPPSVCELVDHDYIGWKSWKLCARTTPSLFVAERPSTYSQGNMEKFWDTRGGWGKVVCWITKVAISLKCVVEIEEKLLWRAYRNSPTIFRSFQDWGSQPHPKLQSLLSQEWMKLRTSNLAGTFMYVIKNMYVIKRLGP